MAANYLLCFMPFLLFRAYYWKSSRWSVYFAALSGLLLLGTFSVGGITTFVCQVLIALFILQHRALGKILLATALPVILLLVTYPRPGQVFIERLRDIASSPGGYASANSVRGRTAQVETAYNTFLDHPILGVGIGNEVFYVLEEVPDWATRDPVVSSWIVSNIRTPGAMAANNLIVQIFAETGIAGGLIFVLFLVSILRDCFRLFISAKEPWKKAVYVSILLALAGQIIHYMGMGGWYFRYWFFVWGLAISAKYLNSQTDPRFLRSPNVSRRPSVAPVKNLTGRMGVGEQKRWIRQL
jgi:O-antigen ligase